ncbi:hypothetical protein E3O06_06395 [Cryobacterium glaciale]|uniref:Uncharacterized protein n=1 Tax=Cryobacterium glaciale TaxID=1259145 RepID=A0A4R8V266_9MICO|nr:hypothetical protein [Cryobacterium glaciale]TFB75445.1 hypothetical protein E3O06_06395 [Cryobacterium glaciale]
MEEGEITHDAAPAEQGDLDELVKWHLPEALKSSVRSLTQLHRFATSESAWVPSNRPPELVAATTF